MATRQKALAAISRAACSASAPAASLAACLVFLLELGLGTFWLTALTAVALLTAVAGVVRFALVIVGVGGYLSLAINTASDAGETVSMEV